MGAEPLPMPTTEQEAPPQRPQVSADSDSKIWTVGRVCVAGGFLLVPVCLLAFSHTVVESIIGVLAQFGLLYWFHKGRHTVHHVNR